VLIRPLPYLQPSALVAVWSDNTRQGDPNNPVSPADFEAFRSASAFADLEAMYSFLLPVSLRSGGEPDVVQAATLTTGMFTLLGRDALFGRVWHTSDTDPGVVLSFGYWQRRFGSDPEVIGRQISIGSQAQPSIIAAVMPRDFVFPYGSMLAPAGFTPAVQPDIWLPLVRSSARYLDQSGQPNRRVHYLAVVGRLKSGFDLGRTRAELDALTSQRSAEFEDTNRGWGVTVRPLKEQTIGRLRPALMVVFVGVGLVLAIMSLNVANLLLARATSRQRELALRVALGASRFRLVQQTFVESLTLALAGGMGGLALMRLGIRVLGIVAPVGLPRFGEIAPDATVFVFAATISLATGLTTGLVPALFAMHAPGLGDGRRTTASFGRRRLRAILVMSEVALAMTLTIGAGLLLHSLVRVLDVDPGFAPDGLLTLQISVPARYRDPAGRLTYYDDLEARLRALPGVTGVGGTTRLPLGSTNISTVLEVEGRSVPTAKMPEVEMRTSLFDYFNTMGIPVVRGRAFAPEDRPDSEGVAVVNTALVDRVFPAEEPIGRRVRLGSGSTGPWTTVVGVIGSVRHASLEEKPRPEIYLSYRQNPPAGSFLAIRTASAPAALAGAVRGAIRASGADAPTSVRLMDEVRSSAVSGRRFVVLLVGLFGVLALVLAAIGVFGIITLIAGERSTEMAIRLALGAAPATVFRIYMTETLKLVVAGVVTGAGLALVLTPLLSSQLFGIAAVDPLTYTTVTLTLLVVASVAVLIPARRAKTLDPAMILRQ
jgi:putative ABC transport system permease protein